MPQRDTERMSELAGNGLMKPRENYLNLPNILSIVRILTAPILIVLLLDPDKVLSLAAALVFALVCLTDWVDGYLARKWGLITAFGKFLDPLADKVLVTTALIMLIPLGRVPAWMVALIIGREMAVTGLRVVASTMGISIPASILGKYKTLLQIIAIVPLIVHHSYFGIDFHAVGFVILIIAFVMTVVSGVDYFLKFFRSHTLGGR